MRAAILVLFLLLGAAGGWLWSMGQTAGTRAILIGFCMMWAGAIGGALSQIGRRRGAGRRRSGLRSVGRWMSTRWTDEGHPRALSETSLDHGPHPFECKDAE
jgi:hypothetical protein